MGESVLQRSGQLHKPERCFPHHFQVRTNWTLKPSADSFRAPPHYTCWFHVPEWLYETFLQFCVRMCRCCSVASQIRSNPDTLFFTSFIVSVRQIGIAYVTATSTALATAVGLNLYTKVQTESSGLFLLLGMWFTGVNLLVVIDYIYWV